MTNQLREFSYLGNQIRIIDDGTETWWFATDVCRALGWRDRHRAMRRITGEDKRYVNTATACGVQPIATVSWFGLHALLFNIEQASARNAKHRVHWKIETKAFRRWAATEVAPAIRRSQDLLALLNGPVEHADALIATLEAMSAERQQHLALQTGFADAT